MAVFQDLVEYPLKMPLHPLRHIPPINRSVVNQPDLRLGARGNDNIKIITGPLEQADIADGKPGVFFTR